MKRLAMVLAGGILFMGFPPNPALAEGDHQPNAGTNCPGGQATFTKTYVTPTTLIITSSADIKCNVAQVNAAAGGTNHAVRQQNGALPVGPCSTTATSELAMGPVINGHRELSYWDPNTQTSTTMSVADPGAQVFRPPAGTQALLDAPSWMGSNEGTITWRTKAGAMWVNGVCTGAWEQALPPTCVHLIGRGTAGFVSLCSPVATATPVAPLSFTPPAVATVAPLLADAAAAVKQQLNGGQVTSEYATGSVVPKHGLIVRVPTCFWVDGANLDTSKGFGLIEPQPGTGRALVVEYVASASEDETWWDFGDGQTATQAGVNPAQQCAITHTYYHVSADVYGSLHRHTPPPGETHPFADTPPVGDEEAVVVWHHIHFSLTAYYTQTDGTQVKQELSGGNPGVTDFWVPSQPEWVQVQQIKSVPFVCPEPSTPC